MGIEFFSLQGDIVALGIEEYPKERVDAQKFIDIVKEQGGICLVHIRFAIITGDWKKI